MALVVSNNPTVLPSSVPTYPAPSQSDLAAVAVTVSVVGILMAILVTWLIIRLRRSSHAQSHSIPIITNRPTSYAFRPSFAPSEASSKFGFIRKSIRLSHRQNDTSWDFADPDPFAHPKESSFESSFPTPSPKHRPAPLLPVPAYTPRAQRASAYKDDLSPRTPTTPATPDTIDLPPPAYCRDSSLAPISQSRS